MFSGRGMYYDYDGNEIEMEEWAKLSEQRCENAVNFHIGDSICGKFHVSTVWLGLNHQWDEHGPPLIFETMAFHRFPHLGRAKAIVEYQVRWSTKEEAKFGHIFVCKLVRSFNRNAATRARIEHYLKHRKPQPKLTKKSEEYRRERRWLKESVRRSGCLYEGGLGTKAKQRGDGAGSFSRMRRALKMLRKKSK